MTTELRLLGELILVREEYPRRRLGRACVKELVDLIRWRVPWHTPLVIDRENHLIDGWRRYEAYRVVYPQDWPLVEVETRVIDCPPEERLLHAAILNRIHGEKLDDNEAADVAARYALLRGPGDKKELRRYAREYARKLTVETSLVLDRLFPPKPEQKASIHITPMPPVIFSRTEYTSDNVRLHCEWLADALAACGREALGDLAARMAMERVYAALDYLLQDVTLHSA